MGDLNPDPRRGTCLGCGSTFESMGRANWLCGKCRKKNLEGERKRGKTFDEERLPYTAKRNGRPFRLG